MILDNIKISNVENWGDHLGSDPYYQAPPPLHQYKPNYNHYQHLLPPRAQPTTYYSVKVIKRKKEKNKSNLKENIDRNKWMKNNVEYSKNGVMVMVLMYLMINLIYHF